MNRISVHDGRRLVKRTARQVVASLGPGRLPDWVIVGAQKAGTTTLHTALHRSSDAIAPLTKEIHYFTVHWDRPERWYREQFVRVPARRTGEASPYYLFHPDAVARMAATIPGARIIVMLRDPVDRAYSHWGHNVRRGREPLGFAEALDAEAERLAGADPDDEDSPFRHYSYVARGMYADQLARVRDHYPPGRILVIRSEDLYTSPEPTVRRVCDWLGIRPPSTIEARNVGVPRAGLDESLRRSLVARFAEDERRVRATVGFGWF